MNNNNNNIRGINGPSGPGGIFYFIFIFFIVLGSILTSIGINRDGKKTKFRLFFFAPGIIMTIIGFLQALYLVYYHTKY